MNEAARFSGAKILLLHASGEERADIRAALAQAGCETIIASDGFEALSLVAEHAPDAVFADTVLSRLTGYQVCALIKRRRPYSATPVVLWSPSDTVIDRARARSAGADVLLAKPCAPEDLVDTLGRLVHVPLSEPPREAQALV